MILFISRIEIIILKYNNNIVIYNINNNSHK